MGSYVIEKLLFSVVVGSAIFFPIFFVILALFAIARSDRPAVTYDAVGRRRGRLVSAPPGQRVLQTAEFVYSRRIFENVFQPAITDMRDEYNAALVAGSPRKAKWVYIRGVGGLLMAAAGLSLGGVVRLVAKAYRGVTG